MKHLLLLTGTLLLSGSLTALATELPHQGMTMKQVEHSYGQPREKLAPVGHPPITRWKYDNYTVYFDHSAVITTVITEQAPPAGQPAATTPSGTLNFKPMPLIKPNQMPDADTAAPAN